MDTPSLALVTRFVRRGAFVWLGYLVLLAVMGFALARGPNFVPWFSIFQGVAFLFVLLLTWQPLAERLERIYVPLLVLLMSAVPIALNHLAARFGSAVPFFSAEGIILRLLPLLMMALVLIGWLYQWRQVFWFCVGVTVWEMICVTVNFAFPAPRDPFLPALPQPPPVFGIPVELAAVGIVTLVQLAVLLVVGNFIARLMKRLREQQRELERLARTDPLTGVFNRRYFWELAEKEVARAKRYEHPLSVALFDLDHFKAINDTYGHLVGDHVIKFFAAEGSKNFRATDLFARYGGEEFVCLLTEASADEAVQRAEEIRAVIQARPVQVEAQMIPVTVSVGVAELKHDENISLGELVNRADFALYKAKTNGRNQVMLFAATQLILVPHE